MWKWPFGVQASPPRTPGSKTQKILAWSLVDPENLGIIQPWGHKLFHFIAVTDRQTDGQIDRQTDGQTDTHFDTPLDSWTRIFFTETSDAWGMGKPQTLQNFYDFTL